MFTRRLLAGAAALGLAVSLLTGCSSDGDTPMAAVGSITVGDPWIKSTAGIENPGLTAAFGVITNSGSTDVVVVSAASSASPRSELHEMSMTGGAMVMQKLEAGITVPAGTSVTLEPGGLHVMVLDLTETIEPGDSVSVTLGLNTGGTVAFDALAKEFAGAQENYTPEPMSGADRTQPADPHTGHHG